MPTPPSRRFGFIALAVILGTSVGVAAAEVVVRWLFAAELGSVTAYPEDDFEAVSLPGIPLLYRPGLRGLTNSQGLLTPHDVVVPKPSGVVRILVIGDSTSATVAGSTERDAADLYPARLERALNAPGAPAVEVLNLSMPGLSLRQEVTLLHERGRAFSPDVVLIAYCINDPVETDMHRTPNVRLTPLALVNLFRLRAYRAGLDASQVLEHEPERIYREDAPLFQQLRETFGALGEAARGVRVAIVPLPVLDDRPEAQVHLEPVARLAAERGVPILEVYRELVGRVPSCRDGDDIHFNAAGHAALADVLARRLAPVVRGEAWPP